MVGLFTKVVMDVIKEGLVNDKTFSKHTDLSADNIMSLLEFIMLMTYVQF